MPFDWKQSESFILIHSQTSAAPPLKFGDGWVYDPYLRTIFNEITIRLAWCLLLWFDTWCVLYNHYSETTVKNMSWYFMYSCMYLQTHTNHVYVMEHTALRVVGICTCLHKLSVLFSIVMLCRSNKTVPDFSGKPNRQSPQTTNQTDILNKECI